MVRQADQGIEFLARHPHRQDDGPHDLAIHALGYLHMARGEPGTGDHGGQKNLVETLVAPRPIERRHRIVNRPTVVALGHTSPWRAWCARSSPAVGKRSTSVIEPGLRLGINPVQVFDDHVHRRSQPLYRHRPQRCDIRGLRGFVGLFNFTEMSSHHRDGTLAPNGMQGRSTRLRDSL